MMSAAKLPYQNNLVQTVKTSKGTPLEIRPLRTPDDFEACLELQYHIWGKETFGTVPPNMQKMTQVFGGITAGAFDKNNKMIAFIYSFPGIKDGEPVNWSLRLGVWASHRDDGLGYLLKEYQRQALLKLGINTIFWSYDPLESRNAHFNFNKLGVTAYEYAQDMYPESQSPLHRGIGTDRLIVKWALKTPNAPCDLSDDDADAIPDVSAMPDSSDYSPDLNAYKIRIDPDIQLLKKDQLNEAIQHRNQLRKWLKPALEDGNHISFLHQTSTRQSYYIVRSHS